MAFCDKCGVKVYPGDRFCDHCGAKLPPETSPKQTDFQKKDLESNGARCKQCGAKVYPGDRFCDHCGAKPPVETVRNAFRGKESKSLARLDLFDNDNRKNMELFNSFSWTMEWEDAAKKAMGKKELGIIMTNLSALASQLHVPETEIGEVISNYIAEAKKREVDYYLLRLDYNSISFGSIVPNSAEEIVKFLRQVIEVARPKYLFILGNEEIVNVATWENFDSSRSEDPDVFSDFAYTVLDTTSPWEGQDFDLDEALRVGRLPTTEGDFFGFRSYLKNAADCIGSIEEVCAFGLTDISWADESQFEFEHFRNNSRDVETTPDVALPDTEEMLLEDGEEFNLLFFNLHGGKSREINYWGGKHPEGFIKSVSPAVFRNYPVPFFLGVEACYGAKYIGLSPEESIMKTALRGKCLGFLGSSMTAWGASLSSFRNNADVVIGEFLKHVSCGKTAADAHLLGLKIMKRRSISDFDRSGAHDILTTVEFALYGDPSACIGKNKQKEKIKEMVKKATGGVPKGLSVPMPDVLKAAKLYLAEVDAEIEAKVDAFAAQYLPFPPGDETHRKDIRGFSQETYQMQNGGLYNKTYSFDTKLGKSFVSISFDKNGKILETAFSK